MKNECNQCNKEFSCIGKHWSQSTTCDHRSISNREKEIITGVVMGDGTVVQQKDVCNPHLQVVMISYDYLDYLCQNFGNLSSSISEHQTAEESAKNALKTGFSEVAETKNYNDMYMFRTISHPELQEFRNWYSTGEKIFPKYITLTPTVLKHWYCCDGTYCNNGSNKHMSISAANERGNKEKIDQLFELSSLPTPKYIISEREDGSKKCEARFTVEESNIIWEYMGKPLPSFEYKWPDRFIRSND